MNSVERVKQLCKDRKIAISRLEKDLGYANGYISQLRKGTFPAERLAEIAHYLSVSVDYLLTGKEKTPTGNGEREISDDDIKFALFGTTDIDDDTFEDVKALARVAAEQAAKRKRKDT